MSPRLKALDQPNPMGGPSLEVMELGFHLLRSSNHRPKAIDLGAGCGRNSFFLASIGFDVTSIEHDADHARRCTELLGESGFDTRVIKTDAKKFVPNEALDLCLCLGILHFLSAEDAEILVRNLKSATTAHGFHVLTISDPRYNLGCKNTLADQGFLGSISAEQIQDWYADWHMLAYERYVKTDHHSLSSLDEHTIEKFIFCRPSLFSRSTDFLRVWELNPKDTPLIEAPELHRLVRSRALLGDLAARFGQPDLEIVSSSPHPQLSSVPRSGESFRLHVAFWGALKLYFENECLTGFARYNSTSVHSFNQAGGHLLNV